MDSNKLENILLAKNGSVKEFPFGDDVVVAFQKQYLGTHLVKS